MWSWYHACRIYRRAPVSARWLVSLEFFRSIFVTVFSSFYSMGVMYVLSCLELDDSHQISRLSFLGGRNAFVVFIILFSARICEYLIICRIAVVGQLNSAKDDFLRGWLTKEVSIKPRKKPAIKLLASYDRIDDEGNLGLCLGMFAWIWDL